MRNFWVGSWLHCPPEEEFVNGRRILLKKLCFGPGESQVWFVTEDGRCWYEETIQEGGRTGDHFLEPVSRKALLRLLDSEIAVCQRLNQTEARLLFQKEKDF
ncbi:hypothetical protein AALB19_16375 [Oscillospiraceae bacterium 50-58]